MPALRVHAIALPCEAASSERRVRGCAPGYAPSDLKPFTFESAMQAPLASSGVTETMTNPAHMTGTMPTRSTWKSEIQPDSEARLDGNQVVLEDQMMKMSEAKADYDAAIGLYQKSLSLLRLAARKPGG